MYEMFLFATVLNCKKISTTTVIKPYINNVLEKVIIFLFTTYPFKMDLQ